MVNTIEELKRILPIPHTPVDCDETQLQATALKLQSGFPNDFVEYGRIYGSGQIRFGDYELRVVSPFSTQYPQFAQLFIESFSELREATDGFESGLTLYPEKDGLFPFGVTFGGAYFCWQTLGVPENWKVVWLYNFEKGDFKIFDLGFAEFLLAFLTKHIRPSELGHDYDWDPNKEIRFNPDFFDT